MHFPWYLTWQQSPTLLLTCYPRIPTVFSLLPASPDALGQVSSPWPGSYCSLHHLGCWCVAEEEDDGDGEKRPQGMRPRRASQLSTATKVKPLPPYSSFFIFSHTNRYVCVPQLQGTCYHTQKIFTSQEPLPFPWKTCGSSNTGGHVGCGKEWFVIFFASPFIPLVYSFSWKSIYFYGIYMLQFSSQINWMLHVML